MRRDRVQICLLAAALLALPAAVQAQFNYTTNNGTITITGYTGPGGAVTIPDTITGLPVISIGDGAFLDCAGLSSVTIPGGVTSIGNEAFNLCTGLTNATMADGVTNIGDGAFEYCFSLTSITIPGSVTTIGSSAFEQCSGLTNVMIPNGVSIVADGVFTDCSGLTSVTIPNGVTSIGNGAFAFCSGLTSITIPGSVTNIGYSAFAICSGLTGVYFTGDAPNFERYFYSYPMFSSDPVTVYYLPGTSGWDSGVIPAPIALWLPQAQTGDASFGVWTNQFGFNISWASGQLVVVEACSNLTNPVWQPVQTNILTSDSVYFSDPQWTNYPARFYRLRQR